MEESDGDYSPTEETAPVSLCGEIARLKMCLSRKTIHVCRRAVFYSLDFWSSRSCFEFAAGFPPRSSHWKWEPDGHHSR